MKFARRTPGSMPKSLIEQMRRHTPLYARGIALLAVYQTLMYLFDRGLWWGVDSVMGGRPQVALWLGAALAVSAVIAMVVRVRSRVLIFNAGRDAEYELRGALLDKLHALGPSFYRRMPTGDIMSRATNDTTQVRLLLGFGVLNVTNTIFALVSGLGIALSISPKLTAVALSTMPILMVVTRKFSKAMFTIMRANQAALGAMSDRVQSSLAGMRVIKSFALEDAEAAAFDEVNASFLRANLDLARLRGSMFPISQAVTSVGMLLVFLYGGQLVLAREISAGGFVAFFWALQRLTWPLMALGFALGMIQRGRAGWMRLREIYDAVPDVVGGELPAPDEVRGELEVRDLTFAYKPGAAPVLDGVSFRVPARGSLALVGRTGSGKSTLAALLPRLLPTPRGAVLLDGVDVCDLPLATVRHAIGYAQQDAFLFSTTVSRNIGYALDAPESPASADAIRDAARDAQVLDEALGLPDGFDTVVGERGVQLSGGQKQRVALARALLWAPQVLVLDDPISAVDTRTETAILETIERQSHARTVVLITHRVAAAARCDRIVVLDGGHVVDSGTHDELVSRPGLYASFAEEQRIERELSALGETGGAA